MILGAKIEVKVLTGPATRLARKTGTAQTLLMRLDCVVEAQRALNRDIVPVSQAIRQSLDVRLGIWIGLPPVVTLLAELRIDFCIVAISFIVADVDGKTEAVPFAKIATDRRAFVFALDLGTVCFDHGPGFHQRLPGIVKAIRLDNCRDCIVVLREPDNKLLQVRERLGLSRLLSGRPRGRSGDDRISCAAGIIVSVGHPGQSSLIGSGTRAEEELMK
jgi:hypothetical protein